MTTTDASIMALEFKPFLRLAKYLPEEFMLIAEELLFLVGHHGNSLTPSEPSNAEEWRQFIGRVHDGWKQAQTKIASLLIDALARDAVASANIKEKHRLRDKTGQLEAKREAHRIAIEILVLRRMLDVILWTIVQGEHATLRRLFIVDGTSSLSAKNINDAMPVADSINSEPLLMAVCTDMLSLVHVGDLLVSDRLKGGFSFIELKTGAKNHEMSKAAEFAVQSGCQAFDEFVRADLNQKDIKHYERVKRQAQRNKQIVDTIMNEGGTDQNTGATVLISSLPGPLDWSEKIVDCYNQLGAEKRWAITTVDECVYVGVYNDQFSAFAGFSAWMKAMKCTSPIYNLMDSFKMPWVRPLGAMLLPLELQRLILRGDILVMVCLDIQAMITAVNECQSGFLSLCSARETADARRLGFEYLELEGCAVKGTRGDQSWNMGAGLRDRVVFDQLSPLQLMQHHWESMAAEVATEIAGGPAARP